ncbi:ParB/RepB/Spo0J family partition protein [Nocardioides zeae]
MKARQTVTVQPVSRLVANPANIRDDLGDLTEMASSIREHGVLQPLTATETHGEQLLLLAGHRRLAAAQLVGLASVPVIIRHHIADEAEQTIVMLVENVQRRDLSPVEKAEAFASLRNRGLTLTEITRRTGVRQSTVSTLLALMDLDEQSRKEIREGHVNAGDAIAAVREVRRARREAAGTPERGRPVVVEPYHFDLEHPLSPQVARICGHTTRPRVNKSLGCGQCWEAVIRADATGSPMPEAAFDEVVVARIVAGRTDVHATPADRFEVARRWRAQGRSLSDLGARTGWNVAHYVLTEDQEVSA